MKNVLRSCQARLGYFNLGKFYCTLHPCLLKVIVTLSTKVKTIFERIQFGTSTKPRKARKGRTARKENCKGRKLQRKKTPKKENCKETKLPIDRSSKSNPLRLKVTIGRTITDATLQQKKHIWIEIYWVAKKIDFDKKKILIMPQWKETIN